jgi:glucose/arabinose dehydrogenase
MRRPRNRAGRLAAGLLAASLAVVLPAILRPAPAGARTTLPPGFASDTVASGFNLPTTMAFLPDGRLLVAEKSGRVEMVKDGVVQPTPFADLSDHVNNYWDRGLVGMAVDPQFSTNGNVYFFYPYEDRSTPDLDGSDPEGKGPKTGRLTRVTATGDVAGPETVILGSYVGPGCQGAPVKADCISLDFHGHSADSLHFGADGSLWMSLGDASSWDDATDDSLRALDIDEYNGKLLHVDRAGHGLAGNPFFNGDATAIRSKVWAYGFRNPFRFSLRPGTDRPYVGDVGRDLVEEIDVATPGANFGWPCYEGAAHQPTFESKPACQALYAQGPAAVKNALVAYDHNSNGAAVTMGPFTPSSSPFPAAYQGGFFFADYARNVIQYAATDTNDSLTQAPAAFAVDAPSPVDLTFGPDGSLYYLSIVAGELHRIRTGAPSPTPPGPGTTYLSDLTTAELPTNGWGPYELDRSNGEQASGDGAPITIGGQVFPKGLGVHAASVVSYDLPGTCATVQATVGVDDEVGNGGSVVFQVWNGTTSKLYDSGPVGGADAPRAISVDVSGVTALRLVVTDAGDGNQRDHADWADARVTCPDPNTPTVTISAPVTGSNFSVGQTVDFAGSAVDKNGAAIPASGLSWQINVLHCPGGGACHVHPFRTVTGTAAGSFVAPDHDGDDYHLEVVLSADDGQGNIGRASVPMQPRTTPLTLTSNPSGLQLLYYGNVVTTPFRTDAVVGASRTVEAVSPQGANTFASWSDGGARQHPIVIPASPLGLDATFTGGTPSGTTYLSDLTPTASTNGWGPYENDRSNGEQGATDGHTLTIGGTTYTKGIGAHANSTITYTVPNGCTAFSAQAGLDDEIGNNGTVIFQIWNGTTTKLYDSGTKTGAQTATPVNVDLTGVTTLRLVITDAADGNGYDHADWADAKLTC